MKKLTKRVTFRMSTLEYDAFQMLVYATRSWDPSKTFRLLVGLGCAVVASDLNEEQAKRVTKSYFADELLKRYRAANLTGKNLAFSEKLNLIGPSDKPSLKNKRSAGRSARAKSN